MVRMRVQLPFERGDLVELFHRRGQVLREAAGETGTRIEGLLPAPMVGVFAPFRAPIRRASHGQASEALAGDETAGGLTGGEPADEAELAHEV
jgi:hypothetical protein